MAAPEMRTPDGSRAHAGDTTADPAIVRDVEAERKELALRQAQAAFSSWRLDKTILPSGRVGYILHKWGRCIDCETLADVEAAMRRVGVLT